MTESTRGNDAPSTAPELPRVPADPVVRSRYRGCLLGGAVGDALGAPVEFMWRQEILRRFGASGIVDYVPAYGRIGAITDDTQMTLFTADGMLRAYVRARMRGIGPVFASVTAHAYLRWLLTQGIRSVALDDDAPSGWLIGVTELFARRAPGNTCLSALCDMRQFGERARNNSKGCGGVMRVAPVGMFMAHWMTKDASDTDVLRETFTIACDLAAITHGHPTGQLAAGCLAALIALLLAGVSLPEAIDRVKRVLQLHDDHAETLAAIEHAQQLAAAQPGRADVDVIRELGEGWVAEEALAIALYCALSATDFESGVVLAVNHDGDSDSTGAIAGHLLGASIGLEAIPGRWLAPLELREVIAAVADDLATVRSWDIDEDSDSAECDFYWNRYPGG